MKRPRLRSARLGTSSSPPNTFSGPVCVDRRTKNLVKRLHPGDIAVIDHADLDRVAAETLVEARPLAVLNAAVSSTGRYPNEGPLLVLGAGIPLVDGLGAELMAGLRDGMVVAVDGDEVTFGERAGADSNPDEPVGEVHRLVGTAQSTASIEAIHEQSRETLEAEFGRFVENTLDYIPQSLDLVDGSLEIPEVDVDFAGRHVLIVVRGAGYREDLELLRRSGYLSDNKPVLVGVDGGADALMEMNYTPDLIIGDFDSVSERTLSCGAELVVHAYRDGRAPGAQRLEELGLRHHLFCASGTSEDIAMLMAHDRGCELIVIVGSHSSMTEFLDKGRPGMASTILVRMKIGTSIVDAKGVSRLYRQTVRKRDLALLVLAALVTLAIVIALSEPIRVLIHSYWVEFST